MSRPAALLGFALAALLPQAAAACTICGNHGDTVRTLLVYGGFMLMPFLLAGGVGFVIYRQVQELSAARDTPAAPSTFTPADA